MITINHTIPARDGSGSWVKKMGGSAWVVSQFSAKSCGSLSCGSRWVVSHSSLRRNFTLFLKNSENFEKKWDSRPKKFPFPFLFRSLDFSSSISSSLSLMKIEEYFWGGRKHMKKEPLLTLLNLWKGTESKNGFRHYLKRRFVSY